jgi:hypothetical protein
LLDWFVGDRDAREDVDAYARRIVRVYHRLRGAQTFARALRELAPASRHLQVHLLLVREAALGTGCVEPRPGADGLRPRGLAQALAQVVAGREVRPCRGENDHPHIRILRRPVEGVIQGVEQPGVLGVAEHVSGNGAQATADGSSFQAPAALVSDDASGCGPQNSPDDCARLCICTGVADGERGDTGRGCEDQRFVEQGFFGSHFLDGFFIVGLAEKKPGRYQRDPHRR